MASCVRLVPDSVRLPEPEFIDAVSRNLRRGRIVVLVAGDGIREGTEQLVEVMQSQAGFRFTFALVELSVSSLPGGQDRLVVPRTLLLGAHTKWPVRLGGKTPRVESIAGRLDAWAEILRRQLPELAARTPEA